MKRAVTALCLLFTVAVFVGIVWIRVAIWNECRADHSWLYCAARR